MRSRLRRQSRDDGTRNSLVHVDLAERSRKGALLASITAIMLACSNGAACQAPPNGHDSQIKTSAATEPCPTLKVKTLLRQFMTAFENNDLSSDVAFNTLKLTRTLTVNPLTRIVNTSSSQVWKGRGSDRLDKDAQSCLHYSVEFFRNHDVRNVRIQYSQFTTGATLRFQDNNSLSGQMATSVLGAPWRVEDGYSPTAEFRAPSMGGIHPPKTTPNGFSMMEYKNRNIKSHSYLFVLLDGSGYVNTISIRIEGSNP